MPNKGTIPSARSGSAIGLFKDCSDTKPSSRCNKNFTDSILYSFGGRTSVSGQAVEINTFTNTFYDDIHSYSFATNEWRRLTAVGPSPRAYPAYTTFTGPINSTSRLFDTVSYRNSVNCPPRNENNDNGQTAYPTGWINDCGEWKCVGPQTTATNNRQRQTRAECRQLLIIYGGYTDIGLDNVLLNPQVFSDLWAYDVDYNVWIPLSGDSAPFNFDSVANVSNPGPRIGASIVSVGNSIYLFGGLRLYSNALVLTNDLWKFNLDTFAWTRVTVSGPGPRPRMGQRIVYNEQKDLIYLYGGTSELTVNGLAVYSVDFINTGASEVVPVDVSSLFDTSVVITILNVDTFVQFNDLWSFNPQSGWSLVDGMGPFPPTLNGVVGTYGNLFLTALGERIGDLRTVRVITPSGDEIIETLSNEITHEEYVINTNREIREHWNLFGPIIAIPAFTRSSFAQRDGMMVVYGGVNYNVMRSNLDGNSILYHVYNTNVFVLNLIEVSKLIEN